MVHPQHMNADNMSRNQHWKLSDDAPVPRPMSSNLLGASGRQSDRSDSKFLMVRDQKGSGSMMSSGTMREGSIYHDAYTGLEELEEQIAIANQMSTQITG